MKELKREILFVLLFMVIGIAVVSTNVVVNMSTSINQNPDDFLVYFSDVEVNGTQDLSLVENEQKLVFNGEFTAVGDKKVISYDVTNASKNYDAEILIDCTESTTYLNITNVFDMKSSLSARSTRTGTLTIELSNAVSEEVTQEVTCTISANAVERDSQGSGDVDGPVESRYPVGKEISIGEEKFNVISTTNTTVIMLAKYNLGTNYRQSTSSTSVKFADTDGWEYSPGPKEIDIQAWSTNPKTYVNAYVEYLNSTYSQIVLSGDLVTGKQLISLGCNLDENYGNTSGTDCSNSKYSDWLVNGQSWWTKSAYSIYFGTSLIYAVKSDGTIFASGVGNYYGIRPVIIISKDILDSLLI